MSTELAWIVTASGKKFHILRPQQDEIIIDDIAHHLSHLCRFTGACSRFYSVAEHCYWVSLIVPAPLAMWGLLHDASEAYLCDLNRPAKHFTPIGPIYREIEDTVMRAICERFGLPGEEPQSVREADNRMLFSEKRQIMPAVEWDDVWGSQAQSSVRVRCWNPQKAKRKFLGRYGQIIRWRPPSQRREGQHGIQGQWK